MQFVRLGELVTHLYISTTAAANTTAASAPNASTGQLLTTLRGSCGWRESERHALNNAGKMNHLPDSGKQRRPVLWSLN